MKELNSDRETKVTTYYKGFDIITYSIPAVDGRIYWSSEGWKDNTQITDVDWGFDTQYEAEKECKRMLDKI